MIYKPGTIVSINAREGGVLHVRITCRQPKECRSHFANWEYQAEDADGAGHRYEFMESDIIRTEVRDVGSRVRHSQFQQISME